MWTSSSSISRPIPFRFRRSAAFFWKIPTSSISCSGIRICCFSPGRSGSIQSRNLLSRDWIDPDLPGEKQQILIPEQEIEDVGIFQKKAALLRNLNGIGREIELLLVHIGVGEVGVHRANC